ncbi:aspartyl protease family protein [Runella sp.]|uniref:aspartyl protease family protein n=1 Tax=Runella sp. TaxID=1960881 RepID=UPI003D0A9873
MKINYLLCCITLFFGCITAQATKPKEQEEIHGLHLTNGRQSTHIQFELHANLIIVPVHINKSDTLRFVLDTGVGSTILTDASVAQKLGMRSVRKMKIEGVGNGQGIAADVTVGNILRMGKMVGLKHNIVVMDDDILRLSEVVGTPIHGIFGYEIFNKFVVTIDFQKQELTLTTPTKYKYTAKQGDKFPIVIEKTKPYLDAVTVVSNDRELPIRVVLDTGAGHALMLNTSVSNIQMPQKVVKSQLGVGLAGVINGHIGRMPKVRIGQFELNDVLTTFPDSSAFGMKITDQFPHRDGNIGGELLSRFKVTFNYEGGYIVLKPNKKRFNERFEHDMSGIDVRAKGKGFRQFYVENIIEGSPAFHAGLQEGDEVLLVNSLSVETMALADLYRMFQRKEGKEMHVVVRRNGRLVSANFALKRII